ncbi:Putative major facilitator superfamily, MFS transporter superfamily [Colletotrichum destructivum]|uniref:Major facilitator superfamily, MFS transporter superfamily n=1 Tax=Colletotrichum destructivum TaxID=34406 RepID=A0AAX4J3N7_9PEZI|nr:Putative major facilitator superfamily, MFS transporter superfamily [Colletotrichum destructivum]
MAQDHHESRPENDAENERTRLIAVSAPPGESRPTSPDAHTTESTPRARFSIVATCIFLIILIELGAYLATIPLNQVLEEIICHNLQRLQPNVNDLGCKDKTVQDELSIIRGWQSTLDYIPGLLTAVPYGFLADRRGREQVLSLSLLGITMSSAFYILVCALPSVFSTRATWLSAVFTFIGGGPAVFNAMIFTIAGDVVSVERRSTIFSYLAAAVVGGELLASPLVYFLMGKDAWLSIYTGLGCLVLGTLVSLMLPETHPRGPGHCSAETTQSLPWYYPIRSELVKLGKAVLWMMWRDYYVLVLLFTFLLTTLGRFAQEILLQYVTKRYGWSWSQVRESPGLLLSVRAFFNLVLLTVVIPSTSYLLIHRWSKSAQYTNLVLARASAALLTLGAFTIGCSDTSVTMVFGLGIFALGSGYNILIRSLLASVVDKDNIGMLYTMMSISETIGALVAGPLLAASFRTGMGWGGPWIRLPYMSAGFLLAVATMVVCSTNLSRLQPREVDMDNEQGSDC